MRRILLLVPFVATLIPPLYNYDEPRLFGLPFFYWYLLAWVFIASALTWIVDRGRR